MLWISWTIVWHSTDVILVMHTCTSLDRVIRLYKASRGIRCVSMKVSLTIRSAHHHLRNNCIIFTWLRILHFSWSTRQFRVLCLLRVRTHYVLHACWLMWRTRVEIVRIKIVMNGMAIPESYITIISWVTWWRWRKVMRPGRKHAAQHSHVILLWTTRR